MPLLLGGGETFFPAAETANQLPPNAVTPSPFTSPAFASFTKRYNGHPLYTFAGDSAPGDTSGQGVSAFGALWYALSPTGQQVTGSGSNGGGGSLY